MNRIKNAGKNMSIMLTGVAIGAVLAGGSILGAAGQGVVIDRPDCVNISYPAFYDTLQSFMG